MSAWRCPGCGYVYDEEAGPPARGLPAGHAVERGPRRLGLPRLRRARQGRLRARSGTRRVTAAAAHDGGDGDARAPPTRRRRGSCCARPSSAPPRDELERRAWSEITMADIAARRRRQPPDPLQGVRQPRRVRPGLRHPRGRALPRRRRRGRARAPRRPARGDRRRARDLPAHRRRGPAGPHPAQRRRHRRHAALRHHPGDAGRRHWATARLFDDDRRGLAAGAARQGRSCSPSPWCGWRSATSPRPATRPSGPPPQAGELLGPFIDRALGVAGGRPIEPAR